MFGSHIRACFVVLALVVLSCIFLACTTKETPLKSIEHAEDENTVEPGCAPSLAHTHRSLTTAWLQHSQAARRVQTAAICAARLVVSRFACHSNRNSRFAQDRALVLVAADADDSVLVVRRLLLRFVLRLTCRHVAGRRGLASTATVAVQMAQVHCVHQTRSFQQHSALRRRRESAV